MKGVAVVAALLLCGCDKTSTHKSPAPPASPPPPETVASTPPPSASASAAPAPAPAAQLAAGPAPAASSVSAAERRASVYDVLSGGPAVQQLPLVDVEPGAEFDPSLRDTVSPVSGPVQVRQKKITVQGGLPQEVVRRIIRQRMGRIRVCYAQNAEHPATKDTWELKFVINPQGKVVSAVNTGGTVSSSISRCGLAAIRALSFPQPDPGGIVVVSYALEFSPPKAP